MRKHLTYKSFFLAVLLAVLSHPGMLSGQQAAADTSIAWIPAFASAFIELEPLRIEQETLLARP
ncbi:MAG: hypothetical protein LBG44_01060, partial [Gemmatimonadota bacterium]|nr:hypothetical protein [Gemmatimonadota bacterium]